VSRDLEEFTAFIAARSRALLRTAWLLTGGDRGAGEDLLQDAFAELFVRWNKIKEPAARERYVRRILVRSATRRWRSRARRAEHPTEQVPDLAIGSQGDDVAEGLDVGASLARLPARQRAVLVLRYYEDMSEAQIADTLGCSTGTVKNHASRALKTLERNLRDTIYVPVDRGAEEDAGPEGH
jgi:RNA polymerase sigma-70 factor (sigma-E family)